jgi:hypothetical protein
MNKKKEKAMALFRLVIREGTGRCEACGSPNDLTCAHNIKCRHDHVRCDVRNAFCLCWTCHRYFEDHNDEFKEWVSESWAFRYMPELIRKSNQTMGQKVDWQERIEFLTDIAVGLKTLKQARLEEV